LLGLFPIVVCSHEPAVAEPKFKRRITKAVGNPGASKRGTDAANEDLGGVTALTDNESANHRPIASGDKTAAADVGEKRPGIRAEIVDLDQTDSGLITRAAQDCGIASRGKLVRDDNSFTVVPRGETCRFDFSPLRIFPVIIREKQAAVLSSHFNGRIGEHVRQTCFA
jgi:hypothetical protein